MAVVRSVVAAAFFLQPASVVAVRLVEEGNPGDKSAVPGDKSSTPGKGGSPVATGDDDEEDDFDNVLWGRADSDQGMAFKEAADLDVWEDTGLDTDTEVDEEMTAVTKKVKQAWAPHSNNWFKAKDDLLFSEVDNPSPDTTKTEKMKQLLDLRSEFICREVLGQATRDCLFEEEEGKVKAVCVPVGDAFPNCCAMALGSVTMLSDLDFTVMCKAETREALLASAKMEIVAAKMLTAKVQGKTGNYPGVLFDTNFYTNTLAYGDKLLSCPCSKDAPRSVAMGLFALARGVSAVAHRLNEATCKTAPNMSKSYILTESGFMKGAELVAGRKFPSSGSGPRNFLSANGAANLSAAMFLQNTSSIFRGLSRRMAQLACKETFLFKEGGNKNGCTETVSQIAEVVEYLGQTDGKEKNDRLRTNKYYELSEKALEDDFKNFCFLAPVALVFANEAYWVEGAIQDVVFQAETLSPLKGTESIMMNLGYTLEHVVHEFHKGSRNPVDSPIRKCNYGDGVIKFGKYMSRVGAAANKMNFQFKSPVITKYMEAATNAMAMKRSGSGAEKNGDALGLPKEYVRAYQWMVDTEGQSDPVLGECNFLTGILEASTRALVELYAKVTDSVFSKVGQPACRAMPDAPQSSVVP
eukprot:TRINITY_DN6236_c0_g1_i1.p1 TRINITY_DN6236_c0_g1~~TRINITY_DN6236_c0_g1_i1.p1  ORF type:complete len:638 (+),score=143.69 TRINITY_DN6236_c0_g1_i1:162-2075(+)